MAGRQAVLGFLVLCAATVGAAASRADEAGFVPLFDGKTLAGWQGDLDGYDIVDGELRGKPKVCRHLLTKEEYGDFVLRLEFRLPPGGNSGIAIRAPGFGAIAYEGMEIQILDDRHPRYESITPFQTHGSIYGVAAAERDALKPAGEWNSQEVTARGSRITVVVNGRTVVDTDLAAFRDGKPTPDGQPHPGLARTKGLVGLLGHGEEVHFRNIRIKRLVEADAAAPAASLRLDPRTTVIVKAKRVVLPPNADGTPAKQPPDRPHAASLLLQEWLRKACRVADGFAIVAEEKLTAADAAGKTVIAVGPTHWVDAAARGTVGQDGYTIMRQGDVISICGGPATVAAVGDRGTLHGAVAFLDRFAGVRFYMPGDLWTSLPEPPVVEIPGTVDVRSQPFADHGSMTGVDDDRWLTVNAANTRAGLAGTHLHNMWSVFKPERCAEKYPGVYPIVGGERYVPKDARDQNWNPCFTNPQTLDAAEQAAVEYFAANPDHLWFSMGLQDGHKSCECSGCLAAFAKHEADYEAAMKAGNPQRIVRIYAALVDPAKDAAALAEALKGTRSYAISQLQWQLLDDLAARLESKLPGKYVEAMAYGISGFAPRKRLRPNVMLYSQIHLGDNVRGLMIPRADGTLPVDAFVDATAVYGEHDWNHGDGYLVPRIYTDSWVKFLRHVKGKRKKYFAVHAEAYPNWGLDGPKLWVISRLWWDPDQDPAGLWGRFAADMFGPAAEPMQRYFATLERLFAEQSVEAKFGGSANGKKWSLTGYAPVFQRRPEDLARVREARTLLDEAARLVHTDEQKQRLDLFSKTFRLTEYLYELGTLGGDDAKVEEVKRYVREAIIPDRMTIFAKMRTEAELDRIITAVRRR
jgi:hypothetical protein